MRGAYPQLEKLRIVVYEYGSRAASVIITQTRTNAIHSLVLQNQTLFVVLVYSDEISLETAKNGRNTPKNKHKRYATK